MKNLDVINQLIADEAAQKAGLFVAPIVPGGLVRLNVCSVVNTFYLADRKFRGWAVLRVGNKQCEIVRKATLKEIREYVSQLISAQFVLIDEVDGKWYGLQIGAGKRGLRVEGPVVINLPEKVAQFQTVEAGFDGRNFWFVRNSGKEPRLPEDLRLALANDIPTEKLPFSNLQPTHKHVYKMLMLAKKPKSAYDPSNAHKLTERERIQLALGQAGARLDSYTAQNDHSATVRFERGGVMHSVSVNRQTLEVISSGICLSGRDRDFDLTSLVGVFNEKDNTHEEDEW